jgi:anti-sigma factor RsiW
VSDFVGANMTCQNVRENLWGYYHRQIQDDLARSMRSHLETCSACAAELQQLKQVDEALDGFASIDPSLYFDQKLTAKLDEAERESSGWGWVGVWLKDRYLWTFVTLFLAATGLWLGFRHQQGEDLRSLEDVVRIQDENLPPRRNPVPGVAVSPQTSSEVASVVEPSQPPVNGEDMISDEDRAVVENLELLQDYDFLKDLTSDTANGGEVKTN